MENTKQKGFINTTPADIIRHYCQEKQTEATPLFALRQIIAPEEQNIGRHKEKMKKI